MRLKAPRRPLVPLALAALVGVCLGTLLSPWPCLALAVAVPLALIRAGGGRSTRAPSAALVLTLCGVAGVFALNSSLSRRHADALPRSGPPGLQLLDGELVSEPREARGRRVELLVRANGQTLSVGAPRPRQGAFFPGARVIAIGRFRPWRERRDPGGYDPRATAPGPRFAAEWVGEREPAHGPRAALSACRRALRGLIDAGVSVENRPLFRAILLGERVGFDATTRRAFATTGTAHLLSISGLHVGLIGGLILLALRLCRLTPTEQRIGVCLALLFYLALVGPRVATVRATVAGVTFFALPGRGDSWNRLALALLAVLAWDPTAPWSLGFQLSFGTVAGILALGPTCMRSVRRAAPRRRRAALSLAGALTCFLASAPLLGLCLGAVPLIALVIGAPSVAIFSLIVALSLLGAFVGVLSPELGALAFALASRVADVLVFLIEAAAGVPGASVDVIPAGPAAVVGVGLVGCGVARRAAGLGARWHLLGGFGIALTVLALPGPPADHPLLMLRSGGRSLIVDPGQGPLIGLGRPDTGRWVRRVRQERRRASVRFRSGAFDDGGVRSEALFRGVFLVTVEGRRVLLIDGDPPLRPLLRDPPQVDLLVAPRVSARNAERLLAVDASLRLLRSRKAVDVELRGSGPVLRLRY